MEQRTKEGLKAKYEYIDRYRRENYKFFSAQLKKEEYAELKEYLALKKMGNAEFVRYAFDKMRSEII